MSDLLPYCGIQLESDDDFWAVEALVHKYGGPAVTLAALLVASRVETGPWPAQVARTLEGWRHVYWPKGGRVEDR